MGFLRIHREIRFTWSVPHIAMLVCDTFHFVNVLFGKNWLLIQQLITSGGEI